MGPRPARAAFDWSDHRRIMVVAAKDDGRRLAC